MAGKAPAFQFYVKDWLCDPQLRQASARTRGMWIDLLCYMWEAPNRGELIGTEESLGKMLGCNNGDMTAFLLDARTFCFCDISVTDNGNVQIRNRRMYREEKNRQNNRLRQKNYREKHACNAKVTVPSSSSSPNTPIVPKGDGDNLFEIFWLNYPKKIGKTAAKRAWKKIHSPKEVLEKMKTVLPRQIESEQWKKDNGQFIPHPATYLNQGRWEDEVKEI